MLRPFSKQIGLNECRGTEWGAENLDAVVVKPLPVAVGVGVIHHSASVWDAVNLEGKGRVARSRFHEMAPSVAGGGLDLDHVLESLCPTCRIWVILYHRAILEMGSWGASGF